MGKHRRYHMETKIFGHYEKRNGHFTECFGGRMGQRRPETGIDDKQRPGKDCCAEVAWIDAGAGKKEIEKGTFDL